MSSSSKPSVPASQVKAAKPTRRNGKAEAGSPEDRKGPVGRKGSGARKRAESPLAPENHGEPGAALREAQEGRPRPSLLTEEDLYLFNEGTHYRLYDKLGAHPMNVDGVAGVYFAVWAPNAKGVHVYGDFNEWRSDVNPLHPRGASGIWEGFIPGAIPGTRYKYHIISKNNDFLADKADPFAFYAENPPKSASIVWSLDYEWGDQEWMARRRDANSLHAPISVYEVHAGSWRLWGERGERPLTYREMAPLLAQYARDMGFTHVEFLPIMEHPFAGSWGYQTTGYTAPTSRFGTPQDFMYLVDYLHQQGIGIILDWVPSHFCVDGHGLGYFDGTHLYEHADPKQGFHPDWGSYIFNYGRHEVVSFLISAGMFWLDKYHVDGLRVDAVASMLYLDYSRKQGEWVPNKYGGNENIEAIQFVRRLNEAVYGTFPDVQTYAEESTAWTMVSHPTYVGGLGFGLKWDMGWMHDTLSFMSKDPIHRSYHHHSLTFRMVYAFSENFILPLSHDEVVHGKGSLVGKMPGNDWEKFANLRLLLGYMYGMPGKKLLFMGGEFAQWREWNFESSLDWHLLQYAPHQGIQRWVKELNQTYHGAPALHQLDTEPAGFEWIDCNDAAATVLTFLRKGKSPEDMVIGVFNFTPVVRQGYRIGAPTGGAWKVALNSDAVDYWGSGQGPSGVLEASPEQTHGRPYSLTLTLPPLGAVFLKPEARMP